MSGNEHMSNAPKLEPTRDGSDSSMGSASEPEAEAEAFSQDPAATQKRKGGRKPIYATSEERKQRNRQAQAAFRERRTEYIKQLETTIKHHEDTLQNLQQSHRSAADECLMLRYKNSLLERILLEKGIDVQAELSAKTSSPHSRSAGAGPSQAPPIQRAIMNRHHQVRRPTSAVMPKVEQGPGMARVPRGSSFGSGGSPQLQPTPPSQTSSPNSTSPSYAAQGVMTPPTGDAMMAQRQMQQQQQPLAQGQPAHLQHPQLEHAFGAPPPFKRSRTASSSQTPLVIPATSGRGAVEASGSSRTPSNFYPSPFQSHIEQLGKLTRPFLSRYDADDDPEATEQLAGPGPFPEQYSQHVSSDVPPHAADPLHNAQNMPMSQPSSAGGPNFSPTGELYGPPEMRADDDPFGLWQSMTFPTQFSFPPSSMR
ncbi:MAG: hypothetical protein M1825_006439 [Sarcosagium campestre]|nr:MAG: hypothetical protein M1825_006439 [Sarcosagium campestre]